MLDVEKAAAELQSKTYQQIQAETAWTWASRSAYYWRMLREIQSPSVARIVNLTRMAEEYEHEALEHAALVSDGCVTLAAVQEALAEER